MVRRDAPELVVVGVGSHAAEEGAHLPLPAPEVLAQDRDLVVVGQLDGGEGLRPPAEQQPALALGAEIPDPLRIPAGRDERTSRMRDPATLSPSRVRTATARLNTWVVNQPGR
jgi:hypothetical protein